jgi:hypothetical protein
MSTPKAAARGAANLQAEMFPDLPKIKLPKRVKSKWEELNELCDLVDKHGPIIPVSLAAQLLDLSRQRVYQLIGDGVLVPVEFAGKQWLAEKQIRAFVEVDRPSGGKAHVAAWKSSEHFSIS